MKYLEHVNKEVRVVIKYFFMEILPVSIGFSIIAGCCYLIIKLIGAVLGGE